MKKLGFGFMRLPQNSKDSKDIDYTQLHEMVDHFIASGFTYFDTAYVYHQGMSEVAFRESVVKRHPRESFTITDKLPTFMLRIEEDNQRIFNEQLERCGVEYFDYYLMHNLSQTTYKTAKRLNCFDFLREMKKQGKIKHIGFSFHDKAEVLETIITENPDIEYVQLQINYLDWESSSIESRKCYEIAEKYNKKVMVMEPIKGGGLIHVPKEVETLYQEYNPNASMASWAIRYAASLKNVFVVLSGMSEKNHVFDNVSYMDDFKPFTSKEHEIILEATDIINRFVTIPCTACQYCVDDCPKRIDIPSLFRIYNDYKNYGERNFPGMHYHGAITNRGKASDCISCKKCERHCPQHIHITSFLQDIAKTFE